MLKLVRKLLYLIKLTSTLVSITASKRDIGYCWVGRGDIDHQQGWRMTAGWVGVSNNIKCSRYNTSNRNTVYTK